MKKYAIIVAGGSGKRMGTAIPKQFLPLAGKPVLMHTIEAFWRYDATLQVVLVLPKEQQSYWQELCVQHAFNKPVMVATGGSERFFSVQNGLQYVPQGALVAVHDGVRPLVDVATIEEAFASAKLQGSGIPVVPLADSLRHVTSQGSQGVPRSEYRCVQTPQAFLSTLLKEAYSQPYHPNFTDDASVFEAMGHAVALTSGNPKNIKLTTPVDLQWAALLLHESV